MNNIKVISTIFSFFLSVICFTTAQAASITVPDDRSTIQSAINSAGSGDTVYVRAGTYNEMLDFNGVSDVTVTRYNNDVVTVTGGNNTRAIRFVGARNVTVSGLNIFASSSVQFIIAMGGGNNNDVTVTGCDIRGGSGTDKWLYQDNSSSHNNFKFTHNKCSGRATYDGPFYLSSSGGLVFSDNTLDFGSLASGSGCAFFIEFMNEEGGSNYCWIERNYWYNLGSQISVAAFMFREADGVYFRNNIIEIDSDYTNASYNGIIQIRGMTDGGDACDNFYFTNNTIVSNISNGILFVLSDTPVNNKLTNNLIVGSMSYLAARLSPLSSGSGNLIEMNRVTGSVGGWASGLAGDWAVTNNQTVQSTVISASGTKPESYYTPTTEIQGISYSWAPSTDYLNNNRNSSDIGAIEFGSSGGGSTVVQNPTGLTATASSSGQ
jgi:hypothetical protein